MLGRPGMTTSTYTITFPKGVCSVPGTETKAASACASVIAITDLTGPAQTAAASTFYKLLRQNLTKM